MLFIEEVFGFVYGSRYETGSVAPAIAVKIAKGRHAHCGQFLSAVSSVSRRMKIAFATLDSFGYFSSKEK